MSSHFDVVIIGGSYAGLSAGLALGRSLRNVLIIDSGKRCNWQTPHSHNFLTQDGRTPAQIAALAKEQVLQYKTIQIISEKAISAKAIESGFDVVAESGTIYTGKKILFATGIADQMPPIEGFAECWGISVLHCPYCHGYEVRDKKIGLIGNGDMAFELCRLLHNWSKNLILFTNGSSTISKEQFQKIREHNIEIVEAEIAALHHRNGKVSSVLLKDDSIQPVEAIFAKVPFLQHCALPQQLGCELTADGFIKVDDFQKTTVNGIYAAGDNTTMFRAVSVAVAAGTKAGAMMNRELIEEEF